MTARQRIVTALLIGAVGLAFADASVVALALPDLYGEFDTSIVGVSWVLTTYALAVAVTADPRGAAPHAGATAAARRRRHRRLRRRVARRRRRRLSLTMLLVARRRAGRRRDAPARRLAAGARRRRAGEGRARRWWALAGAVGAAVGPALGGVLTELFAWRAIFFVQAPIVAAALVVAVEPAARALRREGHVHGAAGHPPARRRRRQHRRSPSCSPPSSRRCSSACCWRSRCGATARCRAPCSSARCRSAWLVGRRFQAAPGPVVAVGGAAAARGRAGRARRCCPAPSRSWRRSRSRSCGAGFDLVHEVLDGAAVPADGPAVQASAVSVGARHAGLVLGLALDRAGAVVEPRRRHRAGDARRDADDADDRPRARDKMPVTWALRNAIEEAPRGQVPDLAGEFDERGAEGDNAMARARDELMDTVTDAVTRSFRPAFGIAAVLAALAAHPRRWSSVGRAPAAAGAGATLVARSASACSALVGVGLSSAPSWPPGARDVGEFVAEDPCTAPPDPYPGDGLDALDPAHRPVGAERRRVRAGHDRERLVLSLDDEQRLRRRRRGTTRRSSEALRVGAHRAIDDANDRDAIPGWGAADPRVRSSTGRPIGWLVDRIDLPGG